MCVVASVVQTLLKKFAKLMTDMVAVHGLMDLETRQSYKFDMRHRTNLSPGAAKFR